MPTSSSGALRRYGLPIGGGAAAGLVAGLFGIGGGVLLVPVLVLLLKRAQHVAHATSLVAITAPAVVGASRFALSDAVAWAPAVAVALGALIGVQIGAAILPRVPERRLRWIFAGLLVLMAGRLLVFGDGAPGGGGVALQTPTLDALTVAAHAALGLAAGTASAVLGIGGGAIIVPGLVVLLGYGQHIAEGTSLAVIVPTALVGAMRHARHGYTDWRIGWLLGLGGVVGALAGAEVALSLPAEVLARGFAVLLLLVVATMLRRG